MGTDDDGNLSARDASALCELDIHVIRAVYGQAPIALCTVPWIFEAHSLTGVGKIAGAWVPCISAEMQLQMGLVITGEAPVGHLMRQRPANHLF